MMGTCHRYIHGQEPFSRQIIIIASLNCVGGSTEVPQRQLPQKDMSTPETQGYFVID